MILSHRYQFLFVHIAKTGGTSIRSALRTVRIREPLYIHQQLVRRICKLTGHRIGSMLPRHASVLTARDTIMAEHFLRYFKFAFVRNPWDRLVSSYKHLERARQDVLQPHAIHNFADFCHWVLRDELGYVGQRTNLIESFRRPQSEYLVDHQGELLVDFVGRFERLEDDFAKVAKRLQLPNPSLKHKRRSARDSDYRSYFTDDLAELAGRYYAADVRLFGYRFDDSAQADDFDTTDGGITKAA